MRSPRMAIAPLSITRRCGSMVTTERPVQIQSADSAASAEMKSRKLQKRRIEWPWEKIFQAEGFRLAVEVGEQQFQIATKKKKKKRGKETTRGAGGGVGGHGR